MSSSSAIGWPHRKWARPGMSHFCWRGDWTGLASYKIATSLLYSSGKLLQPDLTGGAFNHPQQKRAEEFSGNSKIFPRGIFLIINCSFRLKWSISNVSQDLEEYYDIFPVRIRDSQVFLSMFHTTSLKWLHPWSWASSFPWLNWDVLVCPTVSQLSDCPHKYISTLFIYKT